ncbi:MAG: helix-turn-helix transcriptional regulator [Clostridia bacterium]|nr:helix-turn-helix transcriptional regulator [Clostridia bacterium]
MIDNVKIGKQISLLRTSKGLTQAELGERLGVTFQAVSKWERGETLPDISILPSLADILETTIDSILCGGTNNISFKGKIQVSNMIDGINCLKQMGEKLGENNIIYRYAIDGINKGMNTDIEPAFTDDYIFEVFVAEAIIQNVINGMYVDITDIKRNFKHEHFRNIVLNYVKKYNII